MHSRWILGAAACLAAVLVPPSPASAIDRHATPTSFASVFSGAQAGDTIRLAAGSYGTFSGGSKPSTVTITPEAGATASMRISFDGASNLRLQGLRLTDVDLGGRTRNVTIAGSRVTGHTVIRTSEFDRSNVVLDGNTHADIMACGSCYEGRITLPGKGPNPSGVTIRNSLFRGGNADGIQNGSRGTSIIGNEFVDIYESAGIHTDAIQLYGSSNTLVRGNWIHRTSSGIMAPDGADHEVIEHNVIDPGGYPFAITLWSDNGSIVRHNTLPDGACSWNLRCGIVTLGSKSGEPAGRGTVIKDNVLGEVTVGGGSATTAERNSNLIATGSLSGAAGRARQADLQRRERTGQLRRLHARRRLAGQGQRQRRRRPRDQHRRRAAGTDPHAGPDGHADSGLDGYADSGSDGHADSGPDGLADAGSDGHADSGSDGYADAGSDGHADSGSDGLADSGSDGHADARSDGLADSGSDCYADAGSDHLTDAGSIRRLHRARAFAQGRRRRGRDAPDRAGTEADALGAPAEGRPRPSVRGLRPHAPDDGADARRRSATRRRPATRRRRRHADAPAAPAARDDGPQAQLHAGAAGDGGPPRRDCANAGRQHKDSAMSEARPSSLTVESRFRSASGYSRARATA